VKVLIVEAVKAELASLKSTDGTMDQVSDPACNHRARAL